jgi:hypothetical protein
MSALIDTKIGVTAKLINPKDWRNWEHAFRLQIGNYDLDDMIFGNRKLMSRPIELDIRKIKYTKTAVALNEAVSQDPDRPDPTIHEKEDGDWTITDLTEGGQKSFNLGYNYYKAGKTDYDNQKINFEKLRKFVLITVNPDYCEGTRWAWNTLVQGYKQFVLN